MCAIDHGTYILKILRKKRIPLGTSSFENAKSTLYFALHKKVNLKGNEPKYY